MITKAEWRRTIGPLLETPHSWATVGKLTYQTPVDWVVLGVHGEGSAFHHDEVYVSVFVMPLFVPARHITLNHAQRVPSGTSTFGLTNNALGEALASAIAEVPTQTAALEAIADSATEESAYAALLLGRADAEDFLAKEHAPGDNRAFVAAARERRFAVFEAVRTMGVDHAKLRLRQWRDETAIALGIT